VPTPIWSLTLLRILTERKKMIEKGKKRARKIEKER
jgi:hypothetical protein